MEFDIFAISEFSWDVLKAHIKHGFGKMKMYQSSFFTTHLSDETACMTLLEFAENVVDYDDFPWAYTDEVFMEILQRELKELRDETECRDDERSET